jgi:ATP-dependent Lon protease
VQSNVAAEGQAGVNTMKKMVPPPVVSDGAVVPPQSQDKKEERTNVTTEQRKPLDVPASVHVRINSGNLKEYVGPAVYHKDRMYVSPPPPGVSTGLGYLGNGSGAVMPVEATVGFFYRHLFDHNCNSVYHRVCQVRGTCS